MVSPWREAVVAASSSSAPDVIFARDARVTLRPYPAVSDLYVCIRAGARATALGGLMVSSQDHQVSGQDHHAATTAGAPKEPAQAGGSSSSLAVTKTVTLTLRPTREGAGPGASAAAGGDEEMLTILVRAPWL